MRLLKLAFASVLIFSLAVSANATVYRFSFSDVSVEYIELGGNGATNPPAGVFAYLDYDTSIQQFRLYDGPNGYLGSSVLGQGVGLGVNGVAFNFDSIVPALGAVTYPATGSSVIYDSGSMLGLSSINLPSALQGGGFNYAYKSLNNGVEVISDAYKLVAGESETFAVEGFDNGALTSLLGASSVTGVLRLQASSIAIRVQNSTGNGVSWFAAASVSAVPEPRAFIMLALGLMMLFGVRICFTR